MGKQQAKHTVITSDLLVIGGGFGGLWAAIRAKEGLKSVTVVDRGLIGWSGYSHFASGAVVTCFPDDDLNLWAAEILRANDGLADGAEITAVLEGSYHRIRDLENWGIDFERTSTGEYDRIPSRGTSSVKMLVPKQGGRGVLLTLRNEAVTRGVSLLNHIFVAELLADESGRITGAIGIHRKKGDLYVFLAKATVIATNTGGFRGHHLASDLQGTGPFMAYDVGAEVINMEFNLQNIRPARYEIEGSGILPAFGARYVNAMGEYFMEEYDPELKDRAALQHLLTAVIEQHRLGKGPVSLDTPRMTPEDRERFMSRISKGWLAAIHKKVAKEGEDYLRERVEWKPVYETSRGGLYTDRKCRARGVSSLFVAGKAKSFDPVGLTGWSIARCLWSGFVAGESALEYLSGVDRLPNVQSSQLREAQERLYRPLGRQRGIKPDEILYQLQCALFPYEVLIVQAEDRLQNALATIERIKGEDAPRLGAQDIHELIKLREVQTMVINAEMTLKAALMRKESRPHIFCREDYSQQDDLNWLRLIVIKRSITGEMEFRTEPIK